MARRYIAIPPTADLVLRTVSRGHSAAFALGPGSEWSGAIAVAQELQQELGPDYAVFPSAGSRSRPGLAVTVIEVVSAETARELHSSVEALVDEYLLLGRKLVSGVDDFDTARILGCEVNDVHWTARWDGVWIEFSSTADRRVVRVCPTRPYDVDPWYILDYARMFKRHAEIVACCTEGFHDMARLLEVAGIDASVWA